MKTINSDKTNGSKSIEAISSEQKRQTSDPLIAFVFAVYAFIVLFVQSVV